ncbi:cytochrome P450 [Entophlyctis helioformis]|nr:cytochrome P450 [Entophlyctis helioformis]
MFDINAMIVKNSSKLLIGAPPERKLIKGGANKLLIECAQEPRKIAYSERLLITSPTKNTLTDSLASNKPLLAAAALPLLWMVLRALTPSTPKGVPGPYNWPIVGQFLTVMRYGITGNMQALLAANARLYGEVFAMPIMLMTFVVVSDAAAIKTIMNSPDFYRDERTQMAGSGLLDHSLFLLPSGDDWKRHRKLLQPAFGPSHLRHTVDVTIEVADAAAADFASIMAQTGKASIEVDAYEYMTAVALDVIGRVAFSKDFGSVKGIHTQEHNEARHMFEGLFTYFQKRLLTPSFAWAIAGLTNDAPHVKAVRDYTQNLIKSLINDRREALERGEQAAKGKWDMDVLDRLLQDSAAAGLNADKLSEDEIIGETLSLFIAGHETTSNTMTHLLLVLCQNPRVMDKLAAEIDTVYADIDGRLTAENLHMFKYLDWVVKESQRLHPVVSSLMRNCNKPVELAGHSFATGTSFMAAICLVHKNPRYWKDPDSFLPERWAEPPVAGAFMPFGDGPMVCIGQKMANIEVRVAMIRLLRRFSFAMVADQKIDFVTTITTGLKHGLRVVVTKRAI